MLFPHKLGRADCFVCVVVDNLIILTSTTKTDQWIFSVIFAVDYSLQMLKIAWASCISDG